MTPARKTDTEKKELAILREAIEADFVQPSASSENAAIAKELEKRGYLFASHHAGFTRYYPTLRGRKFYVEETL
jgi:hypothetical protein